MIDCCQKSRPPNLTKIGQARFPVTWRSPLAKANDPDVEYKWLHDVADAAAEPLRRRFLDALEKIRGTIEEKKLQAALKTNNVDEVMRALDLDASMQDVLEAAIRPPLEDAFFAAGRQTPARTLGGELSMRFDVTNPNAISFLRNYDFRLIREIGEDTREGIRQVIVDAFEFGGHPFEQARQIKASIGLTQTQAAAVDNFRSLLVNRDRAALTRALRDRRFDPTLERALGRARDRELSTVQVDSMVDRYRERYIGMRAKTIARTETIGASNAGQQQAWDQAANDNLFSRSRVRQKWLVTPDDHLCMICAAIPVLNPDGVPLGGTFLSPAGPIARPGAHPNCRCIIFLTGLGL